MLLYLLFTIAVTGVASIFSLFPTVTELPWGVDNTIQIAVGYYKFIETAFPPLGLFMSLTLLFVAYKVAKILLKFVLGSRLPHLN